MVYSFKTAARIPKGVTADGVMEERDLIEKEWGKASLSVSTTAVLSKPEQFPNLRAFAPEDAEEALRLCVQDGIRYAYSSVIPLRPEGVKPNEVREVRVLFPVPDKDGDMVYEPVSVIKENREQRAHLIRTLRQDAERFAQRMQDVLAEIEGIA